MNKTTERIGLTILGSSFIGFPIAGITADKYQNETRMVSIESGDYFVSRRYDRTQTKVRSYESDSFCGSEIIDKDNNGRADERFTWLVFPRKPPILVTKPCNELDKLTYEQALAQWDNGREVGLLKPERKQ